PVQANDLLAEADEFPDGQAMAVRLGHRTMLAVPLMHENNPIGSLIIRRREVRPFTQKQIDLLVLFANQAAIAIHNVKLFEQLKARTNELAEALQQQTATADVLKAISHSTFDLDAVLRTLVESAMRLCNAAHAQI